MAFANDPISSRSSKRQSVSLDRFGLYCSSSDSHENQFDNVPNVNTLFSSLFRDSLVTDRTLEMCLNDSYVGAWFVGGMAMMSI